MSDFDPAAFAGVAHHVLVNQTSEAGRRTAVGRAYYSVYGVLRSRLAIGKRKTQADLFGSKGRHAYLHARISGGAPRLKRIAPHLGQLLAVRVRADYEYDAGQGIGHDEAERAVRTAREALNRLSGVDDADFATLLWGPP